MTRKWTKNPLPIPLTGPFPRIAIPPKPRTGNPILTLHPKRVEGHFFGQRGGGVPQVLISMGSGLRPDGVKRAI